MTSLSRIVICTAAIAVAFSASASAQVFKLYDSKAASVMTVTKPVTTLKSSAITKYVTITKKLCHATYDPMPGSSQPHFMATVQCAAPSKAADGSACTCPVTVGGRPSQAKGTVFTDTGGPGPVVR